MMLMYQPAHSRMQPSIVICSLLVSVFLPSVLYVRKGRWVPPDSVSAVLYV